MGEPRRVDDELSLFELRLQRWLSRQDEGRFRVDCCGYLVNGFGIEAVVTDTKTGMQGLWPKCFKVDEPDDFEQLPLFRQPAKKQRSLF